MAEILFLFLYCKQVSAACIDAWVCGVVVCGAKRKKELNVFIQWIYCFHFPYFVLRNILLQKKFSFILIMEKHNFFYNLCVLRHLLIFGLDITPTFLVQNSCQTLRIGRWVEYLVLSTDFMQSFCLYVTAVISALNVNRVLWTWIIVRYMQIHGLLLSKCMEMCVFCGRFVCL